MLDECRLYFRWNVPIRRSMAKLSPDEEAQLKDTIDMFEMITQTQPDDYQSLLILKEAYLKIDQESDMLRISKMLAEAYKKTDQMSAALMEYEALYEKMPGDQSISEALDEIRRLTSDDQAGEEDTGIGHLLRFRSGNSANNGKIGFEKIFVNNKKMGLKDFATYWHHANPYPPNESFLEYLDRNRIMTLADSLCYVSQKSNTPFLPLDSYGVDLQILKTIDKMVCEKWKVFPFDKISNNLLVATTNPYNLAAASEIEKKSGLKVVWYLTNPSELKQAIEKHLNL